MTNNIQPPESTTFDLEHFERILAMAYGGEGTWDFSDNDKAALEWVCKRLDSLKATTQWLEDELYKPRIEWSVQNNPNDFNPSCEIGGSVIPPSNKEE